MTPADYFAELKLLGPSGELLELAGTLSTVKPPGPAPMDFAADFDCLPADYQLQTIADWEQVFAGGLTQGATVKLAKHSDLQRFAIRGRGRNGGNCLELFSPKGSCGMQLSAQLWLGQPSLPVNAECDFMIDTADGSDFDLFNQRAGGKWGFCAIQWGPIQSGPTGGIRFMPVWSEGAAIGQKALTVAIQNQPDGRQWLQPPFYNYDFAPIEQGRWYRARLRMTGAPVDDPTTVHCEFWLDETKCLDYTAYTDNPNAQAGIADVFIDICGFWGGVPPNVAPADACMYSGEHFRIWLG